MQTESMPDVVTQVIDDERTRLMQAHAVLKCLYEVLLHTDDDEGQYCADSVQVVAKLIDESVTRLDPTHLRRLLKKAAAQSDDDGVDEPPLLFYGSAQLQRRQSLRVWDKAAEYRAS
jgi:hypothetical protein